MTACSVMAADGRASTLEPAAQRCSTRPRLSFGRGSWPTGSSFCRRVGHQAGRGHDGRRIGLSPAAEQIEIELLIYQTLPVRSWHASG